MENDLKETINKIRKEGKIKDFDSYVYDYKIWEKSKHVLVTCQRRIFDTYKFENDEEGEDYQNQEFWTNLVVLSFLI